MRRLDFLRTTPFRLTLLNGAVFTAGVAMLLGLIYWQSVVFMTKQIDAVVVSQAHEIQEGPPADIAARVGEAVRSDERHVEFYGLFEAGGRYVAGNIQRLPPEIFRDGTLHDFKQPGVQPGARALVHRLPSGQVLLVGHDAKTLAGFKTIIVHALVFSGALMLALGLGAAALLSLSPLRRIEALREASRAALLGRTDARLPISRRRDEMDMLAGVANAMMDETERLLLEVKSVGDAVAHDLRTPLTRLRARLYRLQQEASLVPADRAALDEALAETDALLVRFRALLRIGEIEGRARRAGFENLPLQAVIRQVYELHEPMAEDRGVDLEPVIAGDAEAITADPALMFEAVSNLVENALKFTPPGGRVELALVRHANGPRIEVTDTGPGVAEDEREAVLNRFYRSQGTRAAPGSGLGLSLVDAIVRLHGFALRLDDARPGLKVAIDCWPQALARAI